MNQSLEQRRYDFQLSQIQTHVAGVMWKVRSEPIPRNIKWIERLAKAERKRVAVSLRPMFDKLLQQELQTYIRQVNIL